MDSRLTMFQAEKAKADAEKQAYINPELAEKAREEGNVHFKAGTFAEAVKCYTEAIKRLPYVYVSFAPPDERALTALQIRPASIQ